MKLTRASDYAIRLLTHLASAENDAKSGEIAKALDIPFNHLAKLVQVLSRRGYIITRKGKGGGIRLSADPRKINVAETIEAVEGPIVISDCLLHRACCRFSAKCRARKCLGALRARMLEVLAATTIHDLVPLQNA
jgi:Rrf2 family nitric oxide-sensitive transcriptional repressor